MEDINLKILDDLKIMVCTPFIASYVKQSHPDIFLHIWETILNIEIPDNFELYTPENCQELEEEKQAIKEIKENMVLEAISFKEFYEGYWALKYRHLGGADTATKMAIYDRYVST